MVSEALGRRAVLHGMGCAACVAAGRLFLRASDARAQAAFERLDQVERLRLADMALDLARRAGASHADLRICGYRWQDLTAREGRLDNIQIGISTGFGLRVLIDAAWGFAASDIVDEGSIHEAIVRASENAAAIRRLGAVPVELEALQAYRDDWAMPMRVDPFEVPDSDKIDLLLEITEAAQAAGANYCTAHLAVVREQKFFANSIGSRINQKRVRVAPGFTVTAVNTSTGRFAFRSSLAAPRAAGWEYVTGLRLADEAREAAPQAREKLTAKRVMPGRYDLVIDGTNLWLTIHESVGHATELDRALGWEADLAGTTFVTPDQRGKLQFGSPLMNVDAERTRDGGLSTVGYDDDGVKCSDAGFSIIRDGVFQNYQMAIGQAHLIGQARSNGCAYADGAASFPIQRMPNISLRPNPRVASVDDLIGGVDRGIYVVGNGSWSIDQQRRNFQFGGQLAYEIRDGKRGPMLVHFAYQAENQAFWNAMDGLGDRSSYYLGGTFTCGKGEPGQSAPVSHGVPAARFRQINVLNTSRDDL
jgi:TldD protein